MAPEKTDPFGKSDVRNKAYRINEIGVRILQTYLGRRYISNTRFIYRVKARNQHPAPTALRHRYEQSAGRDQRLTASRLNPRGLFRESLSIARTSNITELKHEKGRGSRRIPSYTITLMYLSK